MVLAAAVLALSGCASPDAAKLDAAKNETGRLSALDCPALTAEAARTGAALESAVARQNQAEKEAMVLLGASALFFLPAAPLVLLLDRSDEVEALTTQAAAVEAHLARCRD